MAITYTNVFWEKILDRIRKDLFAEFGNTYKIYISDLYENRGNLSIRLFGLKSSFEEESTNSQTREYDVELVYYMLQPNMSETHWKRFYRDVSRIEALLFNKRFQTQPNGYINGTVDTVKVNVKTAEENAIEGLNTAKFKYTVQYTSNIS